MSLPNSPLVSIGLPVFNEGRFIKQSLDALLQQDYKNIELIISDNASTDDTAQICQSYANKYSWIKYNRLKINQGPADNFNYVKEIASGQYFMWAAGHDLWSKNYISACVSLLESHPDAVIAYGSSHWINEDNESFGREYGWVDTRGMDVIARYFTIFWGNMHPILGVIRKEMLNEYTLTNTVGVDLIILSHLILKGDFIHAVETSWSRREFRTESSHKDKIKRYQSKEYGLATSLLDKIFPLARLPLELSKAVMQSQQPLSVRLLILLLLLPSFPLRYISGKRIKN